MLRQSLWVRPGAGLLLTFALLVAPAFAQEMNTEKLPFRDASLALDARVDDLVSRLTIEEKTQLLSGRSYMDLYPVERLGVPSLRMADGPLGCRWGKASTAFPAAIELASTWDTALARRFGEAIGREFRHKGRQVWLGPCINIVRVPHGGRNFESYGEDPYLTSRMAVNAIEGAQSQGVAACVKHFAANNQELDRHQINIQVGDRALREIYLPGFHAAVVEAGSRSLMASYNRLNGPYLTANAYMITEILKKEWGFKGYVVSDWGAAHSTVGTANAGMDLEMDVPKNVGRYWGDGKLLAAVQAGDVSEATIDDKVRRVMRVLIASGILEEDWPEHEEELTANRAVALDIAREGVVLLKNVGGLLPLKSGPAPSIAVIGPNAARARVGGGGSSEVTPFQAVSVLDGLKAKLGDGARLAYQLGAPFKEELPSYEPARAWFMTPDDKPGLRGEYFANASLEGEPALTRVDAALDFNWHSGAPADTLPDDGFSARWTGRIRPTESKALRLLIHCDDGYRLYLDGRLLAEEWRDGVLTGATDPIVFEAGHTYDFRFEMYENRGGALAKVTMIEERSYLGEAVAAARAADVAVVCVGTFMREEGEGSDRESFALSGEQNALIGAVAAANPRTIVVLIGGSQFDMAPWIDDVPCVLQAWYPGQEGGTAIAEILFGDVNPSGRLPMSFCRRWEDHPCAENYPGNVYTEGLLVGYRHYDTRDVEPLFAFGHGLSYTSFAYDNLAIDTSAIEQGGTLGVSFDLRNVGERAGAEVVQLYVSDVEASLGRPEKELKAFERVELKAGESQRVTLQLDAANALSFFDDEHRRWIAEPGTFEIHVGGSSRDLRLRGSFELKKEIVRDRSETGEPFGLIPTWTGTDPGEGI